MMLKIHRLMKLHRLMDEAGDGTEGGAGGGSGDNNGGGDNGDQGGNSDPNAGGGDNGGAGDKGSNKPTDGEAKLLKEVMAQKDKLKKADEALTQANERLKAFDGIDPVAVKKLLDDQKKAEMAQLEARGEWDRLKSRMADEHATETKTLKDRINELEGELNRERNQSKELSIGSQFSASPFIKDELTLPPSKARRIYADHFDMVDGQVVGYDKPKGEANRTAFVDASGDPLAFDDVMKKLVDADPERDSLLKSKMKQGAGSHSTPPVKQPQKPVSKTSQDKIAAGLKALGIS